MTIVDREGRPLPDGESGEIVLSNLVNRGSVLLNYRVGDLGRISTGACTCGRTTRVLADLEGRTSEYITRADGSFTGPYHVMQAVTHVPGIARFQLVQVSETSFELRLATMDRQAFDDGADAAARAVQELLGGYDVEAVHVADMAERAGKEVPADRAVAARMKRLAGTLDILRAWPGQRSFPFTSRSGSSRHATAVYARSSATPHATFRRTGRSIRRRSEAPTTSPGCR